MRKYGYDKVSASVTSTTWVTVAQIDVGPAADRVVVAVHNMYEGNNLDTLEFAILAQLRKDGEFFYIAHFSGNGGVVFCPDSLSKGATFWGGIDDFGFETVKVLARRGGPDPIPVMVEFRLLAEGIDG